MLMAFNWSSIAFVRSFQWLSMGPVPLTKEAADSLERAQCCSHEYMTIALYGSSISQKRICQQFQICPALFLREAANSFEWAD